MTIKLYPASSKYTGTEIRSADFKRDWMIPHAYRCLPMTAANRLGWDIILKERIVLEWNGGAKEEDLVVLEGKHIAESHFGCGTITLGVGYSWRTDPGVQLWTGPIPNPDNTDFYSLTGLVETDILDYPWFVTLRMCKPGKYIIEPETPICRVLPVRISDVVETNIYIESEPETTRVNREKLSAERADLPNNKKKTWTQFYHKEAKYTSIKAPDISTQAPFDGVKYLRDNGIMIMENFLNKEECRQLMSIVDRAKAQSFPNDPLWDGRTYFIPILDYPAGMYDKISIYVEEITSSYFKKKLIQTDLHCVKWHPGNKMRPHSDYANGDYPDRDYNVLIYLNDDYEGGELMLPTLNAEIVPKAGCLISFHGGNIFHGVKEIIKGTRYTCISWLKDTTKS